MDDQLNVTRARHQSAFPHDMSAADHRDWNDWESRLDGNEKEPPLEAPDVPVCASRALRKHDQGVSSLNQTSNLAQGADAGSRTVHQEVPCVPQVPAQDGKEP